MAQEVKAFAISELNSQDPQGQMRKLTTTSYSLTSTCEM